MAQTYKVTLTHTLELSGVETANVGQLRRFLEGLDDTAELEISTSSGDRPGDRGTWSIMATWEETDG
jgi:hypothetical protein